MVVSWITQDKKMKFYKLLSVSPCVSDVCRPLLLCLLRLFHLSGGDQGRDPSSPPSFPPSHPFHPPEREAWQSRRRLHRSQQVQVMYLTTLLPLYSVRFTVLNNTLNSIHLRLEADVKKWSFLVSAVFYVINLSWSISTVFEHVFEPLTWTQPHRQHNG